MRLSKTIAQKIVEEMMNVLPYNINVMNEKGIIIGSGERDRIGQIHEGSLDVIKQRKTVEIYEECSRAKPGINEPIIVQDELIGVIGITGQPDIVRPFGKLVRVTAALLIEQSKIDAENHNRRLHRQKFYLELTQKNRYDTLFIERGRSYGLDLLKEITVVIVNGEFTSDYDIASYQKFHHYMEVNQQVLFFLTSEKELETLLEKLKENPKVKKISVGTKEKIVSDSLEKAELALEVGNKIRPSGLIYLYDELRLLINISHPNKAFFGEIVSNLDKSGNKLELIQTLQVYIEENGDINNISKRLNIHRNTLTYRLEKIKKLTGKNPKNLLELFELVCGLAWK